MSKCPPSDRWWNCWCDCWFGNEVVKRNGIGPGGVEERDCGVESDYADEDMWSAALCFVSGGELVNSAVSALAADATVTRC